MAHEVHDWRYFALAEYSGGVVGIAKLREYERRGKESVWAVERVGFDLDSEITREAAWQIASTQGSLVSTQGSLTIARHDLISCKWFIWVREDQEWHQVEAEPNPLNIPEHF